MAGWPLFVYPKYFCLQNKPAERRSHPLAQSKLWPAGTLCITIAANIGESAILTYPACFPDSVVGFTANPKTADVRYVKYMLDAYKPYFQAISRGTTQDNLSVDKLTSLKFPCPPLETQRKIAGILSAYDDLIENNRRRIAILERMAEELYREWFVRMRFPGYQNSKFVKGVPEGWEVKKLADIATSQYGFTASGEQAEVGPRLLRITDIVPSVIDWNNVPYCKIDEGNESKYTLEKGDIVVARTGATVGFAKMILKRHPRSVFASYLVRIRANNPIDAVFVGLSVERQFFKDFINMFVTGAAQPQANATTMLQFPILYPTTELIERFTKQVAPLLNQRELLHIEASVAGRHRKYLLARLLAGTLDVTDLCVRCSSTIDRSNSIGQELAHA